MPFNHVARPGPQRDGNRLFLALSRLLASIPLVALVACGDRIGAPEDQVPPPVVTRGPELQFGTGTITATRTVETYRIESGRSVLQSRRQRTFHPGADASIDRRDVHVDAEILDADRLLDLPIVGLVAPPERHALDIAGHWRSRDPVGAFSGVEVEQEGVGDAPASELRYSRDGRLTLRVRQHWRRAGNVWELMWRETTSPDGSYRDVVDVVRPAVRSPVPRASTTPVRVGLAALSEEEECGPCAAEIKAANEALRTFLFADAAGMLACALTPPPADLLACSVAALKAAELYVKFLSAVKTRDECLARSAYATLFEAKVALRDTGAGEPLSGVELIGGTRSSVCEEQSPTPTGGGSGSDGSAGGYWISICETTYYGYCDTWTGECYITNSQTNCWQEWQNAAIVAGSEERPSTDVLLLVATGRTRDDAPVRLIRRGDPDAQDFVVVDTTRASAQDLGAIVAVFQAQRAAGVVAPSHGSHSVAHGFVPSGQWESGARRHFDGLLVALKRAPASETAGIGTVRSVRLTVPRIQVQRR
jgi:hypothetical protein